LHFFQGRAGGSRQLEREGQQQRLRLALLTVQRRQHLLVDYPFMGCVLIDHPQLSFYLYENEQLVTLTNDAELRPVRPPPEDWLSRSSDRGRCHRGAGQWGRWWRFRHNAER